MSDQKPPKKDILMTLIPGKDALEAVKTPEGAQALLRGHLPRPRHHAEAIKALDGL